MSYRAICSSAVSEHEAQEFGKWLGQYAVEVAGLAVYQIDVDGKPHRDNALTRTIKETIGEFGAAAVMAPVAIPIVGLFPPLAAILAALNAVSIPSWLGLKRLQHGLNKRIPDAGGKAIDHTEITWNLAGVSDKRRKWSEYLLSIYAHKHGWTLQGLTHPEQLAAGAKAKDYPVPWSQRERPAKKTPRAGRVRNWLEEL